VQCEQKENKRKAVNTIKDLMNNIMMQDLNNMGDLMKMLMLKSSRTSIPVRKRA
jgi:hypothetical protein